MPLFDRKRSTELVSDTSHFFIGAPEAEAESSSRSQMRLAEVYEDFLGVTDQLTYEKFIIIGRKGSGKTAIAENIRNRASKDTNAYCVFVKGIDFRLESILPEGKEGANSGEAVFEWIILVKLVEAIVNNIKLSEELDTRGHLQKFLATNRGFVELSGMEVKEVNRSEDVSINLVHFRRFFEAKYGKNLGIKAHKAPFYRIIPTLRRTVVDLLTEALRLQKITYVIIFDDLDVGVRAEDEDSLRSLMYLIRTARDYNQEIFGKTDIDLKVIVLIRQDIASVLRTSFADSAKIFSSYGIDINWFDDLGAYPDFSKSRLKKFIDKRIALNFAKNGLKCNGDPWDCLIEKSVGSDEDSFRFVAKRTLMTPRDLILFFRPLSEMKLSIPITQDGVDRLLLAYARERLEETKNELSLWFDRDRINKIMTLIENIVHRRQKPFVKYEDLENMISDNLGVKKNDAERIIGIMYDYSVFGNVNPSGTMTYFKHRDERGETHDIDKSWNMVLHRSIEMAFRRKVV